MRFPLFIALRYLFSAKTRTAINIISFISLAGVMFCTAALIIVLSVFNGFDGLIKSLFNSFDPDLKVIPISGKVFVPDSMMSMRIKNLKGIKYVSVVLEDNAMLKYRDKQHVATVKGVDSVYYMVNGIDTMIYEGERMRDYSIFNYGMVGQGIAYHLSINVSLSDPLHIYAPRRLAKLSSNPEEAFEHKYLFPSATFSVEQETDMKYVITDLIYARELFGYSNEVSAFEIKLDQKVNTNHTQKELQALLGPSFKVKNRYQQQELFYKIMKSEKFAIYLILSFILLIAFFNVSGSLAMLLIDKKTDISIFKHLGAELHEIKKVFFLQGIMISFLGALTGLIFGGFVCWLQIQFGFIELAGAGTFIISAYPVEMRFTDFVGVVITVMAMGTLASYLPVRWFIRD